ncbi:hypothetical protein HG530_012356 [Fusarium avenaceum]|nr:hypothetical protein HG530_012356 [Fusarium avenaceum]
MCATALLHFTHPVLVRVGKWCHAHLSKGGVVALSGRAVNFGAFEQTECHDGITDSPTHGVNKNALAFADQVRSAMNEAIGGIPVKKDAKDLAHIHALSNGNQVFFSDVDLLGLSIVHAQGADKLTVLEFSGFGAIGADTTNKAVAGGHGGASLLGVRAQSHLDVSTRKSGVDDVDLDFIFAGRRNLGGNNANFGGAAKFRVDDFADCVSGHVVGVVCGLAQSSSSSSLFSSFSLQLNPTYVACPGSLFAFPLHWNEKGSAPQMRDERVAAPLPKTHKHSRDEDWSARSDQFSISACDWLCEFHLIYEFCL